MDLRHFLLKYKSQKYIEENYFSSEQLLFCYFMLSNHNERIYKDGTVNNRLDGK